MQKTITLIIEVEEDKLEYQAKILGLEDAETFDEIIEACLCSDIDEVGSLVQIDCRDSRVQDGKGYKDG